MSLPAEVSCTKCAVCIVQVIQSILYIVCCVYCTKHSVCIVQGVLCVLYTRWFQKPKEKKFKQQKSTKPGKKTKIVLLQATFCRDYKATRKTDHIKKNKTSLVLFLIASHMS